MKMITENTGLSLALVAVLMGGVMWLSAIHSKASQVDEINEKVNRLVEMQTDIAVIRVKIENIEHRMEQEKTWKASRK